MFPLKRVVCLRPLEPLQLETHQWRAGRCFQPSYLPVLLCPLRSLRTVPHGLWVTAN